MEGGGSYIIQADGTRVRAEKPTRSHPEGDAPRTAGGQVIGNDGLPICAASATAGAVPRRRRAKVVSSPLPPAETAPTAATEPAPATPQNQEA